MADNNDDIYDILDKAYESEDFDEVEELVERALALDPDNPEALLLKADLTEDDEDRLPLLEKALAEVRRAFQEQGLSDEEEILEDGMGLVYLGLLQRTAYTLFSMEDDDRSFELVEELLRFDHEDQAMAKTLYYRILLEREEWQRVLEETMRDEARSLGWAYARMIATFMLSHGKGGNAANLNKMLWEAVRMSPNVPFYMLGYIPDPVESEDEATEDEDFHFSLLFEGLWQEGVSRDLLNWFSKATILFGLLSGRFGRESDDMREILDALGGAADYEELTRRLAGAPDDDQTILDALAAGNYPNANKR